MSIFLTIYCFVLQNEYVKRIKCFHINNVKLVSRSLFEWGTVLLLRRAMINEWPRDKLARARIDDLPGHIARHLAAYA